mmetsp:Transcript_53271/g.124881  ORF Transcript_53271/g.124881 Transcript_53271/m.124881 type:complete len:218 (+) Transcript_53271:817-1470(+)
MLFLDRGAVGRVGHDGGVLAQMLGGLAGIGQHLILQRRELGAEELDLLGIHVLRVRHGQHFGVGQVGTGLGLPGIGQLGVALGDDARRLVGHDRTANRGFRWSKAVGEAVGRRGCVERCHVRVGLGCRLRALGGRGGFGGRGLAHNHLLAQGVHRRGVRPGSHCGSAGSPILSAADCSHGDSTSRTSPKASFAGIENITPGILPNPATARPWAGRCQ